MVKAEAPETHGGLFNDCHIHESRLGYADGPAANADDEDVAADQLLGEVDVEMILPHLQVVAADDPVDPSDTAGGKGLH
jgi:hypothetical protein